MALEEGGCLCGAIRYTFSRDKVLSAGHCHCRDCQQATGGGKATIIFVPSSELEMKGEFKTFAVVGTEGSHVNRCFCSECGSPVMSYVEEQPAVKFIKAGSLDNSSWVVPQASYWSESSASWDPVASDIPSFPKNPLA